MTEIVYGGDLSDEILSLLRGCKAVVTDRNVAKLYPKLTSGAYIIEAGAASKNQATLFSVLSAFFKAGVERGDTVAVIGGGTVSDVTGLAAALYMRGIKWIVVPTTLLSMADASIGGKTAIDFGGVKNLVGAFHLPEKTVISYSFLKTLPRREMISGLGEAVKTCLLTAKSYNMLMSVADGLSPEADEKTLYPLISECVEIKKRVTERDPEESGLRKILNVGHTVGHALESADGYKLGHGEYVFKGMMTECAMFEELVDSEYLSAIIGLCKKFVSLPRTSVGSIIKYASADKKNVGGDIDVMLPVSAGEVRELRVCPGEFSARYSSAIKALKNDLSRS